MSPLSPPPWAPKRIALPSRLQRSSSFPRLTRSHAHRCSRLTRQHGGQQRGLVTLTFDLLILKVVSETRVTCATCVPILGLLCSRLKLTFDFSTLKVVSESGVTWATSVPILVFLGLSMLDLGPMYATDRQTSDRQTSDSMIALCFRLLGARV